MPTTQLSPDLLIRVILPAMPLMLRRLLVLVAVLASCVCTAPAQQQRTWKEQKYPSPDGALVAVVRSSNTPDTIQESEVRVTTSRGKLLARHSYASEDGTHGYGVVKAQWTPDSQFFVFSLQSSGGHQPWHSPVQYFSRKNSRFVSLDDQLKDAVSDPQFRIDPPDRITVELYSSRKNATVSLASLSKPQVRRNAAYPGRTRVSGRVLDDRGNPISAEVSAWILSEKGTAGDTHWIPTDEQGNFELNLYPGRYELRAKNALYPDPSLLFGHRASNSSSTVEVLDKEIPNVELRLRNKGFILRGDVLDTDGKPMQGATVTITDAANAAGRVLVHTNKNGEFQILLPAVPFVVEAQAPGFHAAEPRQSAITPSPEQNVVVHLKLRRN